MADFQVSLFFFASQVEVYNFSKNIFLGGCQLF